MKENLINRYVYAVMKYLPKKNCTEIEKEIVSLINEMLAEKCNNNEPTDADINFVLNKIGRPDELALKYMNKENYSLLSGTNLLIYKKVLLVSLISVFLALIASYILAVMLGAEAFDFGTLWGGLIAGLSITFTIVTIIFICTDKKVSKVENIDFNKTLPITAQEKKRIPISEPITIIIFILIFGLFLLGFPELISGKPSDTNEWIPLFIAPAIRSLWYLIVPFILVSIAYEIFKVYERYYTYRLLIANWLCSIAMLLLVTFVFIDSNIINPEFMEKIACIEQAGDEVASRVLKNLHWIILGIIYISTVLDLVFSTIRTLACKKKESK